MRGIWGLAVVLAFVAGSIVTASIVTAQSDTIIACVNDKSQGKDLRIVDSADECRNNETLLEWNIQGTAGPAGPIGPAGESGPEVPISLGHFQVQKFIQTCGNNAEISIQESANAVLLSDGTIKMMLSTGAVTPNPLFGSLPSGVWHDIEGSFSTSFIPDECFSPTTIGSTSETAMACAVNDSGDVYCIDAVITNGVLSGTPWTFKGDAIP